MVNAKQLLEYFGTLFGTEPRCELDYSTDLELLVAIILSAQCTDKRVNIVTKELFARCKGLDDYAIIDTAELEKIIYSTGFYRNKAKNIKAMAQAVIEKHKRVIPNKIEELSTLPGVGRKTASVFLCEYHKIPAIPVDTHVIRVANRLGLTKSCNPNIVERDLGKHFANSRDDWARLHLYIVLFGRYHCTARNPKCERCELRKICLTGGHI